MDWALLITLSLRILIILIILKDLESAPVSPSSSASRTKKCDKLERLGVKLFEKVLTKKYQKKADRKIQKMDLPDLGGNGNERNRCSVDACRQSLSLSHTHTLALSTNTPHLQFRLGRKKEKNHQEDIYKEIITNKIYNKTNIMEYKKPSSYYKLSYFLSIIIIL